MEYELSHLTSEELISLYHKINAELTKQFLNRAPWEEQQVRIDTLGRISKELVQRPSYVEGPAPTPETDNGRTTI